MDIDVIMPISGSGCGRNCLKGTTENGLGCCFPPLIYLVREWPSFFFYVGVGLVVNYVVRLRYM
ncbi:hypothetical protein GQ55_5G241400 [Panicum hallii var. hallii]|uniref:Uncharacterized protein n=1 Tax=Panicum hallii var. hallii TaxID=1504633 RepID=A0A2T7DJR6_9POAL|nr:hypothetical protein GQ55_5G241400 [Panicum hallii var. hallii]